MGKNYYKLLGVPRDATNSQIQQAYRNKALQWHPEKYKVAGAGDEKNAALEDVKNMFSEIAEAYVVLSDARRRGVYDQYGEEVLKRGLPSADNTSGFAGGWTMKQSPDEVYMGFFGSNSPFADAFSGAGSEVDSKSAAKLFDSQLAATPTKPPPTKLNVFCSLEELYLGCSKRIKVTRTRLALDGTTMLEEKTFVVDILPGYKSNTTITFPDDGDHYPNGLAADAVFVVQEKPHPHFKRQGNNLIYVARISLRNALTGCTVDVHHLDGRKLPVPINEVVSFGYSTSLLGEGMPYPRNPTKKGKLTLQFEVQFPQVLSENVKKQLKTLLPP